MSRQQLKDENGRVDDALENYRKIARLLKPELEVAELREIREEILKQENISERTLRRLVSRYKDEKFEGLKPKRRNDKGDVRSIPVDILAEAIKLKEELPYRSIRCIIDILEKEGKIKSGGIALSTLSRQMRQAGCSTREIKLKKEKGIGSRRFQKSAKGMLWQSDVKYGPSLPDPENRTKKKKTYLIAFIDDATRHVVHGEFYFHQKQPILEDCFRKALIGYGTPDRVYIDNGKIFISKWFRAACAHLGVEHLAAAPYSPQSKGKIERFNRTLEEFLQELKLEPVDTLKEMNNKWRMWLEEGYSARPHSSLACKDSTKVHMSPLEAWEKDERKLRTVTPEGCREAFLWEEKRKVDKTGCFTLNGTIYEAGIEYIGKQIEIRYDPFDLEYVEIWGNDIKQKTVARFIIQEYNGRKRKKAEDNVINENAKSGSRLFKALEKQKKEKQAKKHGAISYCEIANMSKGSSQCEDND